MNHYVATILLAGILAGGCARKNPSSPLSGDGEIARYRDSVLYEADIDRLLPPGISHADSMAMRQSIIDDWIDGLLIEDLAAGQIDDMDRIERLTAQYRRSLISDSYRRKMRAQGVQQVDMDSIDEYYRRNSSSLRLERPIIKGLYIKVPSTSGKLGDIREWMKEGSQSDLDALENTGVKEAVQYEYFADRWIDFDVLAGEIPCKLGDADQFVANTTDFETEYHGMTYILHINDRLGSGNRMPKDYAAPIIEERMKATQLANYEIGLLKALREKAIEKEILIMPGEGSTTGK